MPFWVQGKVRGRGRLWGRGGKVREPTDICRLPDDHVLLQLCQHVGKTLRHPIMLLLHLQM